MILDCTEMETPVAMIHVVGTMLYPTDNSRRTAWITCGILKLFQSIEKVIRYSNENERLSTHLDLGKKFGLLAHHFGGFNTLVQSIYDDYQVYSGSTNNEKVSIGLRAGIILETSLELKCSIADSTNHIYNIAIDSCNKDEICISKTHKPLSEEKNTWYKYRSVAHLWAAANKHWLKQHSYHSILDIYTLSSLFSTKDTFTTDLCDNFYNFLIAADIIKAHATHPAMGKCWGKSPLLPPDETWDVQLPGCTDNDIMVFLLKGVMS